MTTPAATEAAPAAPRARTTPGVVALALVPALIVLACSAVLHLGAGRPDTFGSVAVYQFLMNVAALGRFFGLFAAVIVVWGALRTRAAGRGVLALAIAAAPITYAVTAFATVREFFPVGQALYYAVNPLTVAGFASQCAMAALGEVGWRLWRRRAGHDAGPVATWRIIAAMLIGWGVLFFTVLFRGGVTYFFWYQQGYLLLFT